MTSHRNLYIGLDSYERRYAYDADLNPANRTELEGIIEGASRDVDTFCKRFFYAETKVLTLDGLGQSWLSVPDLLVVTSLKLDENRDRTYETTMAATDFLLQRVNHERPWDSFPKTRIVLDTQNGDFALFQRQEQLVLLDGEWGYGNNVEDTGDTVQDATEQDATEKTLLVGDGSVFSVGDTLRLGTEQQYVTGVSGNTLGVARGVNGTTAVVHANGLQIDRYVYPRQVIEATQIQAVRLWKRKEVGFIDREPPSRFGQFDESAGMALQDFVRYDS